MCATGEAVRPDGNGRGGLSDSTPHWRDAILDLPLEDRLPAALDMLSDVLSDDALERDRWCRALKIWPGVSVLLCVLLARPGMIVQSDTVATAFEAYGSEATPETLIPVYVFHLRRALKREGLAGAIHTHRGIGWSIGADAAAELKRRYPVASGSL